jgi:hypothetical protein
MKQIMKPAILITLMATLFCVNVYAQPEPISPLDLVKPIITKPIQLKPMSKNTLDVLNATLRTQDYAKLYDVMSSLVKNEDYINFLLSKVSEGHPPVYWLMADYYSLNNNPKETHKWYYIAIIMTQQDSAVCLDLSARFAAQKTMKGFPEVLTVTRKTPQFTQQAMTEVIFFLESLKQRANPAWACSFGDNENLYPNEKTIKPYLWPSKREEILKKFSNSFSK